MENHVRESMDFSSEVSNDIYQILRDKPLDELLAFLNFSDTDEFLAYYNYDGNLSLVHHLSATASAILTFIYVIVFSIGLIGNSLVIFLVVKKKSMRSIINTFVASLAVADLLITLFGIPFTLLEQITAEWVLGKFMCKTLNYITQVSVTSSVLTMLVIAMERHHAICSPLKSKMIHTARRAAIVCAIIWIFTLIINVPIFFALDIQELPNPLKDQHYNFCEWKSQVQEKRTTLLIVIVLYLVPLSLMTIVYLQVVRTLWIKKAVAPINIQARYNVSSNANMRNKKRATKMLIIVVLLYAISWLPYHVVILYRDFHHSGLEDSEINRLVMASCQLLGLSNSCNNPIIYGFMNDKFRTCLVKIFQSIQKQRKMAKNMAPKRSPVQRPPAVVTSL